MCSLLKSPSSISTRLNASRREEAGWEEKKREDVHNNCNSASDCGMTMWVVEGSNHDNRGITVSTGVA